MRHFAVNPFPQYLPDFPLRRVASDDVAYCLRAARPCPPALLDSVRRHGILAPLLVDAQGRVVSGFARLEAARELGLTQVPVRRASGQADARELLRAAVCEHLLTRGLNPVERAMALRAAQTLGDEAFALREIAPLLGIKQVRAAADHCLQLLELPQCARDAVARGEASAGIAPLLLAFAETDRQPAAEALAVLDLSVGATRRFLREALEVCKRDDLALPELLGDLEALPASDNGARKPDREAVLDALHRRRYPVLTGLQCRFTDDVSALGLPGEARIAPPRDFEGDHFRLEATVRTPEDLQRLAHAILDAFEKRPEALERIFHPDPEGSAQ